MRWLVLLAAFAGFGAGLFVGLSVRRGPEPAREPSAIRIAPAAAGPAPVAMPDCPACPACPDDEPAPAPAPGAPPRIVPPDQRPTTVDLAASVEAHPTWDAGWPADLAPDGFDAQAREALGDCDGPYRLLGTACEEPPCLAVLAGPKNDDAALATWLASCAGWSDAYGSTVDRWTRCSRTLACPSGEVGFYTIAPQRALDRLAEEGFDRMDLKALQQQRCEDATVLFACP